MTPEQIRHFIDAMAASDLQALEVGHAGWTLRLTRTAAAPAAAAVGAPTAAAVPEPRPAATPLPAPAPPRAAAVATEFAAPMFGVVHLQASPQAAPYVRPGDTVAAGQPLCTIEAMKVFNELCAESAARVVAVLVDSGTEVEAGQALFRLEPLDHV